MGTIHGFCASSHANAICAGVASLAPRHALDQVDQHHIGFACFGCEARHHVAKVGRIKLRVLVDLAREKTLRPAD